MKRKMKNYAMLLCLSACLAAGAAGVSHVTTSAEDGNASDSLTMTQGASLYLKEVSGLKFQYTIKNYDATAGKNYGMLIVPYDYLEKAGISLTDDVNDDYIAKLTAANLSNDPIVAENLTPSENGVVEYSIGSILEDNYAREFFGLGFEKTGENTYEYAQPNDNVRSVFEVANLALNKLNYGEWNSENEEDMNEKNLLASKETDVLNVFVEKGFEFVYGTTTPTIEAAASSVDGEVAPAITTVKAKEIDLGIHWNYEAADEKIVTVKNGALKGVGRGKTKLTASLGKAISTETTVAVLKNATELEIYNNSGKAEFFETGVTENADAFGAVATEGGFYNNSGNYTKDSGYIAFKNPNAQDGKYTLDANGTYVDFYFTGNNMPNVEFFGNGISGNMWADSVNQGFVVTNGSGPSALYGNYTNSKDKINTTDYTGLSESYKYNGIVNYFPYFQYGVSDYSKLSSRLNYAATYVEHSMKMAYKATSGWISDFTVNYSNFSMWSLMQDETQSWHYVVGMYSDEGKAYIDSRLYKTAANGEDMLFAIYRAEVAKVSGTVSGYIVAHSALKGNNMHTQYAYTLPYAGNAATRYQEAENATFNADGTVTLKGGVGNSANMTNMTAGYLVLDKDYRLGEYVDIYFTGDNLPQLSFLANQVTNTLHNGGSGFVTVNGVGYADTSKENGFVLLGDSTTMTPYGYEFVAFTPNRSTLKYDTDVLIARKISSKADMSTRQQNAHALSMYKLSTMPEQEFKMTVGFYENASGNVEMSIVVYQLGEEGAQTKYFSLTQASTVSATDEGLGTYLIAYGALRGANTTITFGYSKPYTK